MASESLLSLPATSTPAPKLLLTVRETCAAMSVCAKTLYTLTAPRGSLPAVRIGKAVRYDLRDIQAFIDGAKEAAR